MLSYKQLAIAQASPKPSEVEVPLPNSSIIIKDFSVAEFSILEVSYISLINVDIPFVYISEAPTLVIIASIIGKEAISQGTKQPMCPRITVRAT